MSFKPSHAFPPVIYGADPSAYHLQGAGFARGNPLRTMSRSQLVEFSPCPRKWLRGIPRRETKAMDWGSLVDCLVTTPHLYESSYAIAPETYKTTVMKCPVCGGVSDSKKCAKCKVDRVETEVEKPFSNMSKTCQEWADEQEQDGKTVIKPAVASAAFLARSRLMEDGDIAAIIGVCKMQVQINVDWHDATGIIVPVKAFIDLLPDPASHCGDTIYDLKQTRDASPDKWQRQVFGDGLHYQAALYLDAVNAATGANYKRFGHVIQESEPPHEPIDRILSEEFLTIGRGAYRQDLMRYCWCLQTGKWPRYSNELVEPSAYMVKE